MTAYDITAGTSDLNFQSHTLEWSLISRLIDFSKFTGTASGVASDTSKIITIPAGYSVESITTKIVTASTTTSSTFGLGDSSGAVYYLPSTTSATATAGTVVKTGAGATSAFNDVTSVTTYANSSVKNYTAADAIVVTLGTTPPTNGKVRVEVRGFQTV